MYKLGKKPARTDAVKFKLSNYVDRSALPKPPARFGHEGMFPSAGWGMFGNDRVGDCVFAGAAHEHMIWCKEGGKEVTFTDDNVISDYSAVTGYNPTDPSSDQGTDMQAAADYRRRVGIVDNQGVRHKVAAYLAINPGSVTDHYIAMYLFSAVGIGIRFPASAWDQVKARKPWTRVANSPIEGGHYICLLGKRVYLQCVTWGLIQPLTISFFQAYNDESVVYLSEEMLVNRKSPEGFDYDTLLRDLNALGR